MDQPTAQEALKRLEPLLGEWTLEAKPPEGAAVAWRGTDDDRMARLGRTPGRALDGGDA
jgi:hypothetical protein